MRVEVIAQIHNATRMKRLDKIRATKIRVEVIAKIHNSDGVTKKELKYFSRELIFENSDLCVSSIILASVSLLTKFSTFRGNNLPNLTK